MFAPLHGNIVRSMAYTLISVYLLKDNFQIRLIVEALARTAALALILTESQGKIKRKSAGSGKANRRTQKETCVNRSRVASLVKICISILIYNGVTLLAVHVYNHQAAGVPPP